MGDPFETLFKGTDNLIEAGSWQVLHVAPTAEEPDAIPFSYTIGLYTHGAPELILIGGVYPGTAQSLLNTLGERLVMRDIKPPYDGHVAHDVAQALPLRFRELGQLNRFKDEAEFEYFGYLIRFSNTRQLKYPAEHISAVQVLWPDANGVFPDEPGYDASMPQTLLQGAR